MPKRPIKKEFVKLTAERYGWTCPDCAKPHAVTEITDEVKCSRCGREFKATFLFSHILQSTAKSLQ